MAIIDKAVDEYRGVIRWKNRQVSKFQPKSELGLGIKKRALLFGNRRKNRFDGPSSGIVQVPEYYRGIQNPIMPTSDETLSASQATGTFKLIGSR